MSALFNDPYAVLAIPRSITLADLKNTYHKLMLQYHPDKTGAANHERCQKIIAAYEEILDDLEYKKRTGKSLYEDEPCPERRLQEYLDIRIRNIERRVLAIELGMNLLVLWRKIVEVPDLRRRKRLIEQMNGLQHCLATFPGRQSEVTPPERSAKSILSRFG